MNDPKKRAGTIIATMSGMSEKPKNEMGDEIESGAGIDAASEAVLSAIQSKDVAGLKSALKTFIELCDYEEDSSEPKAD